MPTEKREKVSRVYRLHAADRDLLQNLAEYHCHAHRYTALQDLVPIVRKMGVPPHEEEKRQPLKLQMPPELLDALAVKSEQTGHTQVDLLLRAAKIYRASGE